MASTLATEGFEVHVVSIASRNKVLVHAGMAGLLPFLNFAKPGVVCWKDGRLHYHIILDDGDALPLADNSHQTGLAAQLLSTAAAYVRSLIAAPPTDRRAIDHVAPPTNTRDSAAPATPDDSTSNSGSSSGDTWLLVDADECQKILHAARQPACPAPTPGSQVPQPVTRLPFAQGPCAAKASTNHSTTSISADAHVPSCALAAVANAATSVGDAAAASNATMGGSGSGELSSPATLFEALLPTAPPGRCLAFVQNVHFLPLGPSGTGPRRPALLAAWARLGGVVAVSDFIAQYVREHWPAAIAAVATAAAAETAPADGNGAGPCPPQESLAETGAGGGDVDIASVEAQAQPGGVSAGRQVSGPHMPPVRVVPLATWGVFGRPPFPDLADKARPLLRAWRETERQRRETSATAADPARPPAAKDAPARPHVAALAPPWSGAAAGPPANSSFALGAEPEDAAAEPEASRLPPGSRSAAQPAGPASVVDVAVLKLTPEKGCSVVVELARRLAGRVRFRVVAGDPAVAAVLAPLATLAGSGTSSSREGDGAALSGPRGAASAVELWEPQPDVSRVLEGCVAVLAPSLWLEAWGMVVTEALLRGLPAVISDLGGLPEAGMRLCPAVRVEPIRIPLDPSGVPDWAAREYPRQDIGPWEATLVSLLLGHDCDQGTCDVGRRGDGPSGSGGGRGVHVDSAAVQADRRDGGGGDRWDELSARGRQAALAHVGGARDYLQGFLAWLDALC